MQTQITPQFRLYLADSNYIFSVLLG